MLFVSQIQIFILSVDVWTIYLKTSWECLLYFVLCYALYEPSNSIDTFVVSDESHRLSWCDVTCPEENADNVGRE